MRQTREAELRARLGWEIKAAQLKRGAAKEEAAKLVGFGDTRAAGRLQIAKAFWDGFEEGLKRSLRLVGENS